MSENEPGAKPIEPTEPSKQKEPEPTKPAAEPKVDGNKIIIDGREYDPLGALALIKKLRPYEQTAADLQKKVDDFTAAEQKRKDDELSATDKAIKERDEFKDKYESTLSELETLKINNQKREIAELVGLPPAFALKITGATPEEMEADAKAMKDAMPKGAKISTTSPGPNAFADTNESDAERRRRLGLG